MRTDAEKQAFARECLEIEKQGGDVLGHIEKNWPSYTPRATWYNLQRQYLNRQAHQLTEGKQINPEERRLMELKTDKAKQLDDVLKILEEGKDPIEYLEGLGYKVPTQAWADLKIWARKHRPDDRKKMPDNLRLYYATHNLVNKTGNVHEHNQNRVPPPPPAPQKDVDNVIFGGKEYERYEGEGKPVNSYREKPSPTCCQPANQGGPILWDDSEAMTNGLEEISMEKLRIREETLVVERPLKIAALVSDIDPDYRYERTNIHKGKQEIMRLIWREPMGGGEKYLTFTVEEWKRFAKEIPQALAQLGL